MTWIVRIAPIVAAVVLLAACKDEQPVFNDDGSVTYHQGGSGETTRLIFYITNASAWTPAILDPYEPAASPKGAPLPVATPGGYQQLAPRFSLSADPVAPLMTLAPGDEIVALFTGGRRGSTNAVRSASVVHSDQSVEFNVEMVAARIEHAMAVISNERVLVTGGYGPAIPTVVLSSAEIFSYSTRSFAATGSMHFARGDHAMATLADGRVLVSGGLVPVGTGPVTIDVSTTEIFNPATGTFTDGPAMSVPRFNHSAITLNDSRVLVLGGNRRKSAEVYNPTQNTFTPVGDMAVNHGDGHVAVKLANGRVLVFGGDADVVQPVSTVESFDPATNTFTTVGNMLTARMLHAAVLMPDGKVLIVGGRGPDGSGLATSELYNTATNASTLGPLMSGPSYDSPGVFVRPRR